MKQARAIAFAAAVFLIAGAAPAQVGAVGIAARVNGVEITHAAVERNFEEYQRDNQVNIGAIRYPDRVTKMRHEVLEQLIDKEILWQAAKATQQIASDAEVEAALQQVRGQFSSDSEYLTRLAIEGFDPDSYREHLLRLLSARKYVASITDNVNISDADVHEFYVANPDKFQLPEGVRARHILLKLARDADEESRRAVFDKAQQLLQQLQDGADFADLATRESQDSSASGGGDLGYFPRGKMVQPFEEAAFALQPGEMSGIVESPFGLHIIKVEDHQAAQTVPESAARERILGHLKELRSQQAFADELAALRANADIEIMANQ